MNARRSSEDIFGASSTTSRRMFPGLRASTCFAELCTPDVPPPVTSRYLPPGTGASQRAICAIALVWRLAPGSGSPAPSVTFSVHRRLMTDEQAPRWMPGYCSGELITAIAMGGPGAGSDLRGIRTTAVRDGDSHVINGQKTFSSNGQFPDLV